MAEALDGRARGVVADLGEPGWLDAVALATEGLEIGLAVANAAVSYVGRFLEQPAASRAATIQVNCLATTDLAAWALPGMVARGRGAFIVTSSGSALAGTGAVATYSASKAYVLNLAEAIGWELRDTGVVCQAVVAPAMDTPGWRSHPVDEERMLQHAADPRAGVEAAEFRPRQQQHGHRNGGAAAGADRPTPLPHPVRVRPGAVPRPQARPDHRGGE